MTLYFGEAWDVPALDYATQAETPVGAACGCCSEAVAAGDVGWIRAAFDTATGPRPYVLHAECELLGIVGHLFGVCSCTGFDTTSREAARELWRRVMIPGGLNRGAGSTTVGEHCGDKDG